MPRYPRAAIARCAESLNSESKQTAWPRKSRTRLIAAAKGPKIELPVARFARKGSLARFMNRLDIGQGVAWLGLSIGVGFPSVELRISEEQRFLGDCEKHRSVYQLCSTSILR